MFSGSRLARGRSVLALLFLTGCSPPRLLSPLTTSVEPSFPSDAGGAVATSDSEAGGAVAPAASSPPPMVEAGAPPSLTCGAILPGLGIGCNDSKTRAQTSGKAVPVPVDGLNLVLREPCALPKLADPGASLEAALAARCDDVSVSDPISKKYHLAAHVARQCGIGPQGSDAQARPVWTIDLNLPDASRRYRVSIESDSSEDLQDRCKLSLGISVVPPIRRGRHQLFSAALVGGVKMPISLDCTGRRRAAQQAVQQAQLAPEETGLAWTRCYDFPHPPVPPPVKDVSIDLTVSVQ